MKLIQLSLKKKGKKSTNFPELISFLIDYENKKDEESIFIYELDKIISALNHLFRWWIWLEKQKMLKKFEEEQD